MDTTRPYAVLISIENNDLKTECSCPYNFEGACKYIVAAILALADEPKLASIINPFRKKACQHQDNKNYAENLKIHQTIIDALLEMDSELAGDHKELGDWLIDEIHISLKDMAETIIKTDNINIQKIGIEYLCGLFENKGFTIGQGNILEHLQQIVTNYNLAGIALTSLGETKAKQKLEDSESSLLAHLCFLG